MNLKLSPYGSTVPYSCTKRFSRTRQSGCHLEVPVVETVQIIGDLLGCILGNVIKMFWMGKHSLST